LPILGDARDPERRRALLRHFRGHFEAVVEPIRASGTFDEGELAEVWAAWDRVEAANDAFFCHALGKLEARVR
jgi:hypothetical protein